MHKELTTLLSPILIVIACQIAARVGMIYMGNWTYDPVIIPHIMVDTSNLSVPAFLDLFENQF